MKDKDKTEKQLIDELINTKVFDVLGDALSIQDTDFKILYQNIIAKDMIGDHTGEFCYKVYEGRDSVCPDCSLSKSFKDGKVHREERENPSKSGKLHVEITSSPLRDPKGRIFAGMEIVRDITDRKKVEEELESSEKLFKTLFKQAAVGVAQIVSKTGQFVRVNQRYCDIVGYSREEMEKMTFQDITHPDDLQEDLDNMKLMIADRTRRFSIEKRYIRKNGSVIWVNLTVSPMWKAGEKPDHNIGIVEDITERKEMEDALQKAKDELEIKVKERTAELEKTVALLQDEINERKLIENNLLISEERYRVLFEDSPISLWEEDYSEVRTYIDTLRSSGVKDFGEYFMKHPESVMDCAGKVKVVNVNMATVKLYKAKSKKEFMTGLKDIFTEDTQETFKKVLIAIADGKTKFGTETTNQTLTGDKKNINLQWIVAVGHEKTYSKVLVSIIDITERKKIEQKIIESESKLQKQKKALEHKNIALKELIKHIDVEKNKLKENITININRTLMPIIAELETCEDPHKYVGLLKCHLEEMQSSFGRNITGENYNLTAREIEICNMIKGGARSKDISNLLNISYETVEKHRKNIRKKLGISSKKVNLFYFLQKL